MQCREADASFYWRRCDSLYVIHFEMCREKLDVGFIFQATCHAVYSVVNVRMHNI
jgi:hypothetical protein